MAYAVDLTVPAASAGAALTGFPVRVDLADMPAGWWAQAAVDGGNVRVRQAGSDLPIDVVHIDTANRRGEAFFKATLSGTDANVFSVELVDGTTKPAASDPIGRNAVWSDYDVMVHFAEMVNRTGGAATAATSGTITDYPYELTGSQTVVAHQGMATDAAGNTYIIDTDEIIKYDPSWVEVDRATTPLADTGVAGVNHLGDGTIANGELFIPFEVYPNSPTYNNQHVGVWDPATLNFLRSYNISAQAHEVASIAYNGDDGHFYLADYTPAGDALLHKYTTAFAYVGTQAAPTISQKQSIDYYGGAFWAVSAATESLHRWTPGSTSGTVQWKGRLGTTGVLEGLSSLGDGRFMILWDGTPAARAAYLSPAESVGREHWLQMQGAGDVRITGTPLRTTWTMGASVVPYRRGANGAILSYTAAGSPDNALRATMAARGDFNYGLWNSSDGWLEAPITPTIGQRRRVHHTHTGTTNRRIYVDGVLHATDAGVGQRPGAPGSALLVGVEDTDAAERLWGSVNYVYLRNGELSAAWLAAEQASWETDAFYTVEDTGSAITVLGEPAAVTVTALDGQPIIPIRVDGEAAAITVTALDGTPIVGEPIVVAGEAAAVTVTALDGTPVLGGAGQTITVGTEQHNLDTSTRRRTGEGFVDISVPVAPEPPTLRPAPIRVNVDTLPAANITSGVVQPMTPTVLRSDVWGRVRVVVSNNDVTYFRDKPAQVADYQLLDPYGYGPATLRFPQVTFWELPDFGTGPLSWLRKNAPVRIQHVAAGEGRDVLWFGHIDAFDFDDEGALVVDCSGELIGRMDKTVRTQRLIRIVRDAGFMARIALSIPNKHYRLKGSADDWGRTGTPMENTGGGMGTNLAFLDYLLANMTDESLQSWTILPTAADPRTFDLTERNETTTHATVYLGARGVQAQLRDDQLEQPNRMFGEGVAPNGARWRNAVYPNLWDEQPPAYPFGDGRTFGAGTSDTDTDTGVGITLLEDELWGSGLLDLDLRDGTWSPRTTEAVEDVQRQAGLPVTGRVDTGTWAAVFGDGDDKWRMTQAEIRPLDYDEGTEQWLLSANGSKLRKNPAYDRGVPRIERMVSFGEGVRKRKARRWLRRERRRANGVNWRGTITLSSDVLAGEHTFGDPGTPLSRLDLKAGQNIRVKRFGNAQGFLMHIASVQVSGLDGDSPQVTLAVDTQFRDAITLAEMLERDKAARMDPARRWLNQHRRSAIPSDSLIGWDREAGAGVVRRTPLKGGEWNIVKVVGGQAGEVQRIDLHTVDTPAEFICAVFAAPVSPGRLNQRIGDPFIETEPGEVWRRTDVADWLAGLDKDDLEAWKDEQRRREQMRKVNTDEDPDNDEKWVPPEYEAGNIVRNDRGEWESVLSPPDGQEVADLQAELANQREERLQATFELFADARVGVYIAGTTQEPCGYWPKKKTNANGNPTGEPVTGRWRDDAGFSYWTIGPGGPWLYLAVFPDRDCTIYGRMYDQLIEGA